MADLFTSMSIGASALTAERTRMNVISQNLANANTTQTADGGPYRKKHVVFESGFAGALQRSVAAGGGGVRVAAVVEDGAPPRLQYDPGNPSADKNGYVAMPNVNVIEEMAEMMTATRAYEANVSAIQATKAMAVKTLELGR